MALFANFFWLAFAIGILVWGANKFIDSSSLLAKELGLSELTIGLTIIALGTSAPEIFIAISSVINNTGEIAMGTVVGSNISNIALIFGVSCIGISYRPTSTPILQFIPFFLAACFLGYALYDLRINIFESLILILILLIFLFVTYKTKNSNIDINHEKTKSNISQTFFFLIVGLAALIGGSHFAVSNAESIAEILKVPQLIIGLTIIAIGTSLPELAATISAIVKEKNEMVIGNIIGSNVMNIVIVVPIIGFFSKTYLNPSIISRDFIVMALFTALFFLIALNYSSKKFDLRIIRFIGSLFVGSYLLYILILSNTL